MQKYRQVTGGVCAPKGFLASGVPCSIKYSGRKDLTLIYSQVLSSAAAVFTNNRVKAAPVLVSQEKIKHQHAQAIVVNSGCANCYTGEQGMADAYAMVQAAAHELLISPKDVLVASTGTIGMPLPMRKVLKGIKLAAIKLSTQGGDDAAHAILTTDTRKKEIALELEIAPKEKIRIGAMVKGSGMINPYLATMLGFVTTDAKISGKLLQKTLKQAVFKTFNMITVDNDKSTNDTVFVLANGQSDSKEITDGSARCRKFEEALDYVCQYLAKEIVRDGEGATKLFEVKVTGACSNLCARKVARTVAGSNLVKTAVYGADANWGRIAAAAGDAGVKIDPAKLSIKFDDLVLVRKGKILKFSEAKASAIMHKNEFRMGVDLGEGICEAKAWGCDLTEGYIKINAKYRT